MAGTEIAAASPPGRKAGFAMLLLLALLAGGCGAVAEGARGPYGHPARLVRLPDGRALNLVCQGRGAPTVLFESGYGAGASAWTLVQPVLARRTRTCSYDR